MLIRIGMGTDTNTVSLYNHRITRADSIFTSFGHGIHRIEYVFSVAIDNLQILETGKILRHFPVSSLFRFRNGNSIAVILYYKNDRKPFEAGTVDGLIDKSFGSRRFSMRGDSHSFMPIIYHCPCHTHRMKVMCSCCGRDVLDMPFRFGKMVRHMTSSASGICCL